MTLAARIAARNGGAAPAPPSRSTAMPTFGSANAAGDKLSRDDWRGGAFIPEWVRRAGESRLPARVAQGGRGW